jgi:hypothetical protein
MAHELGGVMTPGTGDRKVGKGRRGLRESRVGKGCIHSR